MKGVESAMYLGNRLNKKANIREEITYQMQQVTVTWKRLQTYWKATDASKKWQLLAYDAIIKSKLLYGLETAQPSKADLKRIDAFQLRGIRQILGKKHTYWDRSATNSTLFDMASRIISGTTKTRKGARGLGKQTNNKKHKGNTQKTDLRTKEDQRVDEEKWLHREQYDELISTGILTGHKGNASGTTRSNYWPDKVGIQPDVGEKPQVNTYTAETSNTTIEATLQQENDTLINDIEALRMLWIKDDTSWNTAEVFGEHRKKLRPFSEDYKYKKSNY